MDEAMVARWNEIVGDSDEVWHLGDFAIKPSPARAEELLAALHGRKHLVTGNNDPPAVVSLAGWASVQPYAELVIDDQRLVLCYYPFRIWRDQPARPQSRTTVEAAASVRCRRRCLGFQPGDACRDPRGATALSIRSNADQRDRRTTSA